jgi:cell division protein ZapA (FtsZ GTPase activity inhibitor)
MFLLSKYNTAYTIYFPLIKRSAMDFAVSGDYTHSSGDVKISKDGGAAATATNAPSAIIMGNGAIWSLTLTAAEMSAAVIVVTIVDAATKAVEDQCIVIYTYGNASAKYQHDLSDSVRLGLTALPNAAAEALGGLYTRGTGAGQINQPANGQIDANTKAVGGTTQTARDLGASVLLSSGTGAGQVSLSSGTVTVGTNNDKTGYGLSATAVQAIWDALTSALTTVGSIGKRIVDYLTGDIYARLGAPAGASIAADIAAIKTVVDAISTYVDTEVAAIKAKTDNLPASPANEATLATIASYVDTEVAAIKAKTDNLPSDPADASDIAASFSSIVTQLNTIAAYVDTEVAAIKAKTDNLPSDPASESTLTTILNRIGAFTGSGVNTILGFFKALAKKDASNPSDLGGTYTAANDSLEALREHGDAAWYAPTGGGDRSVTIHLVDELSNDVPGILVSVYNSAETVLQAYATSDVTGLVHFNLSDGTYHILVRTGLGYEPLTAQTLVVDGVESVTYELTPQSPTPPASALLCRVRGYIYDAQGQPMEGQQCTFTLKTTGVAEMSDPGTAFLYKGTVSVKTDGTGLFQADLLRSSEVNPWSGSDVVTYQFVCASVGINVEITVPDADNYDLVDALPA